MCFGLFVSFLFFSLHARVVAVHELIFCFCCVFIPRNWFVASSSMNWVNGVQPDNGKSRSIYIGYIFTLYKTSYWFKTHKMVKSWIGPNKNTATFANQIIRHRIGAVIFIQLAYWKMDFCWFNVRNENSICIIRTAIQYGPQCITLSGKIKVIWHH